MLALVFEALEELLGLAPLLEGEANRLTSHGRRDGGEEPDLAVREFVCELFSAVAHVLLVAQRN